MAKIALTILTGGQCRPWRTNPGSILSYRVAEIATLHSNTHLHSSMHHHGNSHHHHSNMYHRSNTRSLRHSILYHLKHMHILKICHKTMKHLKRIC